MYDSINEPNTDYRVIVKYKNRYSIYKFDKRRRALINTKDETDMYSVELQLTFNKNGNMKEEFLCIPKKKENVLTLKKQQ